MKSLFRGLLFGCLLTGTAPAEGTRWTMLNVTPNRDVADCHVIRFPDGTTVLIDAGLVGDAPNIAVERLKAHGVTAIDLAIISHFHIDHYGALLDVLAAGITIKKVAVNVPDKRSAESERPWGCDWDHVQSVLAELRSREIECFTPRAGERLIEVKLPDGDTAGIDVLALYDGFNTPIGQTDVNDTSILLRLFHGQTRALFTGDLNHPMGAYLAEGYLDLRADLLKVPHHGTEGAAPNSFFNRVKPRVALVPSPKHLWTTVRSKRIRDYFHEREIPVYVSGDRGNITVTLKGHGYHIDSEH